jgi:uncharacterized protein
MKSYLAVLIIGLSLIISVILLGRAYNYKFKSNENIAVVGLAEVDFVSDLIVWEGSFSRKNLSLKDAYAGLKNDENEIRAYFSAKGIPDSALVFSAVDIMKDIATSYDRSGNISASVFTGYLLTQKVKIESMDIDKVEKVSREVGPLIEKGIEFNSGPPMYFYTKLADLKMNLLSKASEDAKARSATIAESAGSKLGRLKKSTMGIFQITGKNKNENFSYGGSFNTMDKLKTASVTVRTEYLLE